MSAAAKVGAFFLVALLIAAWFILRIQNFRLGEHVGTTYVIRLPEAQGLPQKSPVLLRGVRVGRITDISLVNDGVAAQVLIRPDVPIREGAVARVVSIGLLGEKQLEIIQGKDGAPVLPEGSTIEGNPTPSLDTIVETAGKIGKDVSSITDAARDAMVGPDQENKLGEALTSFVELTRELKDLTSSLNKVVHRFERATRPAPQRPPRGSLDPAPKTTLATARACAVDGSEPESEQEIDPITQSVQDTREASAALRRTAEELETLVQGIRQGQGTVGQLLTSTETADRIDETLSSIDATSEKVGNTLGFASNLRFGIGFRADYRFDPQSRADSYLTLDIIPSDTTFLRLQGIGTQGHFTGSALVGKRFDPVVVRLGIIRATPGLGGDLILFGDRLRLTGEVWNFQREGAAPHARIESAVYPFRNGYLVVGWDDFLTVRSGLDALFLGAGIEFGN